MHFILSSEKSDTINKFVFYFVISSSMTKKNSRRCLPQKYYVRILFITFLSQYTSVTLIS